MASLAGQTHSRVQHVIVDGASADGSAEWASQHSVFADTVIISEPDRGIYHAMNKGLGATRGEVVCFLNSGDCFASRNVLEEAAASFQKERWRWAFGLGQMVDGDDRPVRWPQRRGYSWVRQTFWHYVIYHPAVFMETDFLRSLGGFDERYSIAADYHLITRAGRIARPVTWPAIAALTLDGGVSTRNLWSTHWQSHQARVDALSLRPPLIWLDFGWTLCLLVKTRLRQHAGRLLRYRQGVRKT